MNRRTATHTWIALTLSLLVVAAMSLLHAAAGKAATPVFVWPVRGDVITPYRNGANRYAAGMHRGIDIAAPVGAAIGAAVGGTVTFAARLPDGGLDVTVRSDDGRYLASYMQLSAIAVHKGDRVAAGQRIGAVGQTGRPSSPRPHLHLGVRVATTGVYVDPLSLLGPIPVAHAAPPAPAPQPAPQTVTHSPAAARPRTHRGVRPRHNLDHAQRPAVGTPVHERRPAAGRNAAPADRHAAPRHAVHASTRAPVAVAPMPARRVRLVAAPVALPHQAGGQVAGRRAANAIDGRASASRLRWALLPAAALLAWLLWRRRRVEAPTLRPSLAAVASGPRPAPGALAAKPGG